MPAKNTPLYGTARVQPVKVRPTAGNTRLRALGKYGQDDLLLCGYSDALTPVIHRAKSFCKSTNASRSMPIAIRVMPELKVPS